MFVKFYRSREILPLLCEYDRIIRGHHEEGEGMPEYGMRE